MMPIHQPHLNTSSLTQRRSADLDCILKGVPKIKACADTEHNNADHISEQILLYVYATLHTTCGSVHRFRVSNKNKVKINTRFSVSPLSCALPAHMAACTRGALSLSQMQLLSSDATLCSVFTTSITTRPTTIFCYYYYLLLSATITIMTKS